MSAAREMVGLASFAHSKLGPLEIGDMVSRHPEPRYSCVCGNCSAAFVISHTKIRNRDDRCPNSACGRDSVSRRLAEERKAGKRDAIKSAEALENEAGLAREREAAARMNAEVDGYEVPSSRPNKLSNDVVMSERERSILRAHKAEVAAQEAAAREAAEAPIREATERLKDTHRKLAGVMRSRLQAELKDPDVFVDPAVATVRMSEQQAADYNRQQFREYRSAHSEVYWTSELIERLGAYFDKNGLQIVSALMIDSVVQRFKEYGLLPERPAPEPSRPYMPKPTVNLNVSPARAALVDGWDLESGEPRKWTPRELDRLSSTDYRKALRLYKSDLGLPNVGPGVFRHDRT